MSGANRTPILGSPETMSAGEPQLRSRADGPRTEAVEQHRYLLPVAREIQESTEDALRRRELAHRLRAAAGQHSRRRRSES